jgi:hypothetical protein
LVLSRRRSTDAAAVAIVELPVSTVGTEGHGDECEDTQQDGEEEERRKIDHRRMPRLVVG